MEKKITLRNLIFFWIGWICGTIICHLLFHHDWEITVISSIAGIFSTGTLFLCTEKTE